MTKIEAPCGPAAQPQGQDLNFRVGDNAAQWLLNYVERIERLEEEKRALAEDVRDVYAEAKGNGFEPKVMRKVIALRRMDSADRQELDALLDLYRNAVGI